MTAEQNAQVEEALLPCPLCGGKFAIAQEPHDNHPVESLWYLFHMRKTAAARKCRLEVEGHFGTEAEAVRFWNTRAQAAELAALKAREAELVGKVELLHAQLHGMQDGSLLRDEMARADRNEERATTAEARNAKLTKALEELPRHSHPIYARKFVYADVLDAALRTTGEAD